MSDLNFPQKVLRLTAVIPLGKVVNYGHMAYLLDKPRAARAVGYALRTLSYETDVPWHRVVGKAGKMGKISLRAFKYSEDEQVERLTAEGIVFNEDRQFLLSDYLWQPHPLEIQQILNVANELPDSTFSAYN